jgi:F-type H+-transporting ATPase subunit epsilon
MAKHKQLRLTVITSERQVLDEPAEAIVIPAHDGELGVLPDRAALMCELGIGQLRYESAGGSKRLFIDGGFGQVFQNRVTVLTSNALTPDQVTPEQIAAAERDSRAPGTTADAMASRLKAQRRAAAMERVRSG